MNVSKSTGAIRPSIPGFYQVVEWSGGKSTSDPKPAGTNCRSVEGKSKPNLLGRFGCRFPFNPQNRYSFSPRGGKNCFRGAVCRCLSPGGRPAPAAPAGSATHKLGITVITGTRGAGGAASRAFGGRLRCTSRTAQSDRNHAGNCTGGDRQLSWRQFSAAHQYGLPPWRVDLDCAVRPPTQLFLQGLGSSLP